MCLTAAPSPCRSTLENDNRAMDKQNIMAQIESLEIGSSSASLTFSQRLARENTWTEDYSSKVILEYKRFIYLVCLSDSEVTPSDEVDQAWHLHLTYTESYWYELCKEILGFELHHNPTKGGKDEQSKYEKQYIYTLSLYEEVYGETPPMDIWPPVDKRFEAVEEFVRVNQKKKWIIRKPDIFIEKFIVILAVLIILVACTENPGGSDIWFWLKVALGVYIIYKIISWFGSGSGRGKNSGSGGGCGGCSGCGGCGG